MALRALMLRKKIDEKKKALSNLRTTMETFETREKELEDAIDEAETEEEKAAVEEEVDKFESDKKENADSTANLEKEIADLENELREAEEVQPKPEERKEVNVMETRKFFGMNIQERDAFFANDSVKEFISNVRTAMKEKRAITNAGLIIPEVMLPLLKEVIESESVLEKLVYKVPVTGTARQTIMGTIPEAVWTEMCATLNELSIGFNATEVDGYKVGGYFAICNATLEDNDVNLASELISVLGKSIAKALDKAIVYGKGVKMPMGIVTRLAQTTQPSDYSATDRAWADLHTSNVITGTGKSGLALFKEIATNKTAVSHKYSNQAITWIMSENTKTMLQVESMDKNSGAAIVAGLNDTMPVVGGKIVTLECIPDGEIVYGHMDNYLLAERAGTKLESSEHVRFIQDQTVFKGTARYDGKPVIAEAFGVMSITSTAPTTSVTFAADTAN